MILQSFGLKDGFDGAGEWEKALGDTTAKLQKEIVGLEGGMSFDELLEERGGKDSIVILKVEWNAWYDGNIWIWEIVTMFVLLLGIELLRMPSRR